MITGRVSNLVTTLFTQQKTNKLINQIKYQGESLKLKRIIKDLKKRNLINIL